MKYAIISNDNSGPALGVGTTISDAWNDTERWGIDDHEELHAIEITEQSFREIRAGNPDAVFLTEDE